MIATREAVPTDPAKELDSLQKAAVRGDASAQFRLGVMYRIGDGVPGNATGSADWFRKAAAQGNADAQLNLGVMYNTAEGVSKNYGSPT